MKNFNVETATIARADATLTVGQSAKADSVNASRILFLERDLRSLPQYMTAAIEAAGYKVSRIGGTTYQSSVWALYK